MSTVIRAVQRLSKEREKGETQKTKRIAEILHTQG